MSIYSIYIKMGCECNLHCKYCHAEQKKIRFNPEIVPVLKSLNVKTVTFGGGEPLLYWKSIREIVEHLGKEVVYKITTNGTLFTQEIVDFCNQYKFYFYISMDGIHSTRDTSKPIPWDLVKQLNFCSTGVTIYKENQNVIETLESLNEIKSKYLTVFPAVWSSFPNFVHSTSKTGLLSDREMAKNYVEQMTLLTKQAIEIYKKENKATIFLKRVFNEFVRKKDMNGVFCCNDKSLSILADGTICVCPYTYDIAGHIFQLNKIDWEKIKEQYTRPSCKSCDIFHVCGNRCCKDITDNQCYVNRKMYENITKLMKEYDISYKEFETTLVPFGGKK